LRFLPWRGRLKARLQRALPNSSRVHLDAFVRQAAASLPPGARILDAGAGSGLYRPHFEHVAYESADFGRLDTDYGDITYRCDLTSIPADDGRFDLVLCTQVLEHVPEPAAVLGELARVLKPGGSLWLTAPLFYQEHQAPYDFYRYTQYGLRHLVEGAGFTVERL